MAGGRVFGTSIDDFRPFDERGRLSLSLPLFLPDGRSSADSQYDREELVRPDKPGLWERSMYSLAVPCIVRHLSLSSSSSSSSPLLDVGLLIDSGFDLVGGAASYEDFDVRGGCLLIVA